MGTLSSIKGAWVATWSGMRHVMKPRMTLRYPDQKLDLQGPGYHFDPKNGVGLPGFRGRHFLRDDKCTGCQLCAIACDGVAVAIEMQTHLRNKPQNKKNIFPAVDYGRCVFCGLCVDACPFDALSMTNDYELSAYDKDSLKYSADMLMIRPAEYGNAKVKFDTKKGDVTHG